MEDEPRILKFGPIDRDSARKPTSNTVDGKHVDPKVARRRKRSRDQTAEMHDIQVELGKLLDRTEQIQTEEDELFSEEETIIDGIQSNPTDIRWQDLLQQVREARNNLVVEYEANVKRQKAIKRRTATLMKLPTRPKTAR